MLYVLREFNIEWKAIVSLKDQENDLMLPMLSKNTPPLKWCESFEHYLANTFGVRNIPLSYVVREKVDVDPEAEVGGVADLDVTYDPLQPNKSHGSSGSVLDDLIKRSGHNHALFKTDNATVYSLIEQAARSSPYLSTIKPFETRKNGCAAWNALLTSHVGKDQWEKIQKENSRWLMQSEWNGKRHSLESYCSLHRAKFIQL